MIVNAIMFCDYEGHGFTTEYALRVQNFTAFTLKVQHGRPFSCRHPCCFCSVGATAGSCVQA